MFSSWARFISISIILNNIYSLYRIMVPEKASSFNIHPERTCSDCCFYCRQKFGLFDTPLHISQMKSVELQKFAMDYSSCSRDACLCDKCYRLVDRSARNMKKESEGEPISASEKVRSCFVRNCNKEVRLLNNLVCESCGILKCISSNLRDFYTEMNTKYEKKDTFKNRQSIKKSTFFVLFSQNIIKMITT